MLKDENTVEISMKIDDGQGDEPACEFSLKYRRMDYGNVVKVERVMADTLSRLTDLGEQLASEKK